MGDLSKVDGIPPSQLAGQCYEKAANDMLIFGIRRLIW